MKPTDAVRGRDLTLLIEDYLEEGVRDENDLETQEADLLYITQMANKRETRLAPEERKAVWNMINYIRLKLQGQQEVEPNRGLPQRGFHYSPAVR